MNRQNVTKWFREFSEGRTDVHHEQRSGRPSLFSDDHCASGKIKVGYIGPSAVQSGPRTQRFLLVSSPKETSRWEKVQGR